mgnify:CR=1 FL=1
MRSGIPVVFMGVWWSVTACGGTSNPGPGSEASSGGGASSSSSGGSGASSTSSSGGDSNVTGSTGGGTTSTGETSGAPTTSGTSSEPGSSSGGSTGSIDACSFKDLDAKLCWQEPPAPDLLTWDEASAYCEDLNLRLPTVQELASLVRGCPSATCPVEDPGCLSLACRAAPECQGCGILGGPGMGGCYWDAALSGPCDWYWTSSGVDDGPFDAWFVYFQSGAVDYGARSIPKQVRCVRSDP